jgi:hypothetical protein
VKTEVNAQPINVFAFQTQDNANLEYAQIAITMMECPNPTIVKIMPSFKMTYA